MHARVWYIHGALSRLQLLSPQGGQQDALRKTCTVMSRDCGGSIRKLECHRASYDRRNGYHHSPIVVIESRSEFCDLMFVRIELIIELRNNAFIMQRNALVRVTNGRRVQQAARLDDMR